MKDKKLNQLVKVSLLSVIACVLMFLELSLPIFPSFLKVDISDLPALMGTFALGPVSGIMIELFKNILHGIFAGQTAFIGELANFGVGASLVLIAGLVYNVKKSRKTAVIGLVFGTIVMALVAAVLNYFVLLPLYQNAFNFPISQIIAVAGKINGNVNSVGTLIAWTIIPFNLFKGAIVTVLTLVIYKSVSPILKKENNNEKQVA
ncbi:riboflavin transporter FmnP [Clostridium algifaecis]|uniref:Riboflavin transporter n=1 Tax=Clostridium algifaecis TaxID=1472040 RepID=A0ABS4KQW3_9CLOT|nr:ECF transporter S component [Clostridium algifaecis]MBP2032414.1 riboflavin transporter FmnP [Clostridium algifaecis]